MRAERYLRQQKLGEGQMSVVWLALDTSTQNLVALKIMTTITEDDRRNQKAKERFQREIDIACRLQHPHILPILDYGSMQYENRYVPYLVSPYVPTGSLASLIQRRSPWLHWSLLQTADVIMQAADSLWYLHSQNPPIVHEDVKLGNFLYDLVEHSERVAYLYLCDFGISRWMQDTPTMASELLGTFQFMAPEQFDREVNCASDQYALAVMTCYLLTGKLPIQAPTHDAYPEAHLRQKPFAPSLLNPDRIQSAAVDEIVLQALEKRPEKRFPSIIEFARVLNQAITHYVQEQTATQTREYDVSRVSTKYVNESRVLSPMSSLPFQPDISIALDPPEADERRILDEPLPLKPVKVAMSSIKSEEMLFTPLSLKEPVKFFLPARPKMLAWSCDGRRVACVLYGHIPLFMGRDGNMQEIRTAHASQATNLCWSPDQRTLAIAAQGEIRFWDTATQSELPLVLRFNVRTIDGLDWSINEQLAVWVEDQILVYTLSRAQMASLQPSVSRQIATNGLRCGNVGVLRWSPDGSALVAGASNGSVVCWYSSDRQDSTWQVAAAGQKVTALAWSPDGSLLAVAFRNNRVVGWDHRSQQEVLVWKNLPAMPRMLSISTGMRIVIASGEHRLLLGTPGDPFPLSVLPGQQLAVWSPLQPELVALDEHKEHVLALWRE
ncbi:MAG TPA: WD40 repeat domain-containing serine/threonine protein kinase [Ktedonobacteraceae bacterium]